MTRDAGVYAQALYGLMKEENGDREVLEQIRVLDASLREEPAFLRLLANPSVPKQERTGILDESFRGKLHPHLLSFLKLLTEKGHIRCFSDCAKAYTELYNADHGILPVQVTTAAEMTQAQKQALTRKLVGITGKTVELICTVDPAVLGGVRLDYDGKRVDGTVKNRLEQVRSVLNSTPL